VCGEPLTRKKQRLRIRQRGLAIAQDSGGIRFAETRWTLAP
jgi:hypothetical protein